VESESCVVVSSTRATVITKRRQRVCGPQESNGPETVEVELAEASANVEGETFARTIHPRAIVQATVQKDLRD
jgi:hypothetical protein